MDLFVIKDLEDTGRVSALPAPMPLFHLQDRGLLGLGLRQVSPVFTLPASLPTSTPTETCAWAPGSIPP